MTGSISFPDLRVLLDATRTKVGFIREGLNRQDSQHAGNEGAALRQGSPCWTTGRDGTLLDCVGVREDNAGAGSRRLIVADKPSRLHRIVGLQVHRPSKCDRLIPELSLYLKRAG